MDTSVRLFVLVTLAVCASALPAKTKKEELDPEGICLPYKYCEGESFPERVKVQDFTIRCNREKISDEDIKQSCCLPQERHLVCYDIEVEGDYLNYSNNTDDLLMSTDFTDLCREMVKSEGRKEASYNAATFLPGKGEMAFIYGHWKVDVDGSERHIRHLACGVGEKPE